MSPLLKNFTLFATLLFFLFIWARFVEPNIIRVEKLYFEFDNFPQKETKILHITDTHSYGFGHKEEEILRIVKVQNPDFIFLTGDIVDWKTTDFASCALFWKKLAKGRENRIFAVYGNHEHRNPNFAYIEELLRQSGITVLVNESTRIETPSGYFFLIGLDDPHLGFDNVDKAMEDSYEDSPKIVLAHSPEIFRKIKKKNIDLVLVGHTHGCQINIPIICDWIVPLNYDKQYKQGLFQEEGTYMYVSRGVGEGVLPFRLNCFPEVTIITINPIKG